MVVNRDMRYMLVLALRTLRKNAAMAIVTTSFMAAFCFGCSGQRCYENEDCKAPRVCSPSGQCVYECSFDPDCGEGFQCVEHRCAPHSTVTIACPDDMVNVSDVFCVDRYEASRPDATSTSAGTDSAEARSVAGVIPWQVTDNAAAEAACAAAGKRLCTSEEWRLACKGPDSTIYSYGDSYDPETCNGIDAFGRKNFHLAPTGSFSGCTNEWGLFDINGNLWEHIAGGSDQTVRGGAHNCGDSAALHKCDYVPGNWSPSALGFRCCLTPDTSGEDVEASAGAVSPRAPRGVPRIPGGGKPGREERPSPFAA